MANHQRQFELMAPFLDALALLGIEPKQLFSRHQAAQDSRVPEGEVSGVDFVLMLESAVELSGDPGFAIRLGQTLNICDSGAFGFALMSCATFRDTLHLMLGYQKVLVPGPYWQALPGEDGVTVRMDLQRGSAEQHRLVTELAIAMNVSHGRFLSGDPLHDLELQVNYPEPDHRGTSLDSLSVPAAYDREYSQMWMPERVLSMPVKTAEPAVHVLYLQQCEEILSGMGDTESATAELRQLLLRSAGSFPDVSTAAAQMNVSERTLRRRLKSESASFRVVLDDVKNVLARRYLANTALDVADIAHLLGYSEPENLYRAFARWNGMTPAEYRREQD